MFTELIFATSILAIIGLTLIVLLWIITGKLARLLTFEITSTYPESQGALSPIVSLDGGDFISSGPILLLIIMCYGFVIWYRRIIRLIRVLIAFVRKDWNIIKQLKKEKHKNKRIKQGWDS